MSISLIPHTYHDGDTVLTGHLGKPEGTPRGLIIIYPNIANMNAAVAARASQLAGDGYLVLVADFYGEPVKDFASSHPMGNALRADVDVYRARIRAALAAGRALEGAEGLTAAVIGYCMGGQAALELAREGGEIAAAVSYHGLLTTNRKAEAGAIKAKILVCHGDADPLATREQVSAFWEEMDQAGADWHFHAYGKVKHGFTDPESDNRGNPAVLGYDAAADRASWAATTDLFDSIFTK
ncbi:dienelactone hydrolase family protein [Novosphingobium sp.]|uniref:dienelactone hydrolase family protein n=1 Tax=Novosphingobium sp. TaxID=1874826 RepID=UPI0031E2C01F